MDHAEEISEFVIPMDIRYKWSAGSYLGRFLRGLREGKIIANRCPSCGHTILPPMNVCARCHVEAGEWVGLSARGTIVAYNFVVDPLYDAGLGDWRPLPYTIATIALDGASDAAFYYKLEEREPEKVRIGMRVEAVFKPEEEREGTMGDIIHFRTIN